MQGARDDFIDADWLDAQRRLGAALATALQTARLLGRTDLIEAIDALALCATRDEVIARMAELAKQLEPFRRQAS